MKIFSLIPKPIRQIKGVYQIFLINIQLFDDNHEKTHCHPLVAVLLPNKRQTTYETVFREIKHFF